MKYIDEYRDRKLAMKLADQIKRSARGNYVFMEVCGGHTSAIYRFGIPSLLPENIKLLSGPGCPVCVTGTDFIDLSVEYSKMSDVVITTFGDLIRVPGSETSLDNMKSAGADIRIVFSGLDALEIARLNPDKKVIFLGIGFETTAPGSAVTVKKAMQEGVANFSLLSAHKLMPPVMDALLCNGAELDGFICPGHVSAITGSAYYNFIPEKYKKGCVVAGFEPTDILQAILMLVRQVNNNDPAVEIQYTRVVTKDGNRMAMDLMKEVFKPYDALWRGFGQIPASGLIMNDRYKKFDPLSEIPVRVKSHQENKFCICGPILRGIKTPGDCSLFRTVCNPDNPVGACMVSPEGSCNTWYKYRLL